MCVPLLNISPLERLFVSQSVLHTERAARALPSLYGHALVGHFYSATSTRVRVRGIDAHAQYYTWCNRPYCEKTSGVCDCTDDHASEQGVPTMSSCCTTKANFAKARARQNVQSATALLHRGFSTSVLSN